MPPTSQPHPPPGPAGPAATWADAARLGSVWAALEIVVGAFLHNIRLPFAGALLASSGVAILVAGHRLRPRPGLIWRAAAICAAMKSISPSRVILGPMAGILLEGTLLQGIVRGLGGGRAACLAGGAVAVCTPLLQQAVLLLAMYGLDIVTLLVRLTGAATQALRLPPVEPVYLLAGLVCLHAVMGLAAGLVGLRLAHRLPTDRMDETLSPPHPHPGFRPEADHRQLYSRRWLGAHLVALPLGLAAAGLTAPVLAWPLLLTWLSFCLWRYPAARRSFHNRRLWLEIVLVGVLAGWLLGDLWGDGRWAGVLAGAAMAVRAAFTIVCLAAIGTELRNPKVLNHLFRLGWGGFATALEAAFDTLPSIMNRLGRAHRPWRRPVTTARRVLADVLTRPAAGLARIHLIVGGQGVGKTRLLDDLSAHLTRDRVPVGGVLQPIVRDASGHRLGYDLQILPDGPRLPLCRLDDPDGDATPRTGRFRFNPATLRTGELALACSAASAGVMILDEIGPLELAGGGWAATLSRLAAEFDGPLLLAVRPELAAAVVERWAPHPAGVWPAGTTEATELAQRLGLAAAAQPAS